MLNKHPYFLKFFHLGDQRKDVGKNERYRTGAYRTCRWRERFSVIRDVSSKDKNMSAYKCLIWSWSTNLITKILHVQDHNKSSSMVPLDLSRNPAASACQWWTKRSSPLRTGFWPLRSQCRMGGDCATRKVRTSRPRTWLWIPERTRTERTTICPLPMGSWTRTVSPVD